MTAPPGRLKKANNIFLYICYILALLPLGYKGKGEGGPFSAATAEGEGNIHKFPGENARERQIAARRIATGKKERYYGKKRREAQPKGVVC